MGPLQFEIAKKCHLPVDIPVLCGIYASGANIARHLAAGLDDFTLISTGEWLVVYQPHLPLDQLEPLRDTAANVDLLGRPVACARFMAGREYAAIAGAEDRDARAEVADVAALVAAGTMALPSFTRSGGPFPGTAGKGQIVGAQPNDGRARVALASLYLALMASACLDLLRSRGQVIIDGAFADHRLFAELLAALRPGQPVAVSSERQGAALGAALLWGWSERTAPAPSRSQAGGGAPNSGPGRLRAPLADGRRGSGASLIRLPATLGPDGRQRAPADPKGLARRRAAGLRA